ncbi:glycosyltransferase family 4 protein [Aureimonas altamirensis]|uniref:glycosyltransferase family 4 protein n=1 Tax=Aureimonas altamirensis TaxID=370622 RepID=UPI003AFA8B34
MAVVLKGYPRLSETFIAQEILGLERLGFGLDIWSLRRPTDRARHPMHEQITAPVAYLPEYLKDDPLRVLRGVLALPRQKGFGRFVRTALADLRRDPSPNRLRRIGQAAVLARELAPEITQIYAHFLHTPASVARYAAQLRRLPFSFSAHAKDIWTTPDWEKREKIADSIWGTTCTRQGHDELVRLSPDGDKGRVRLVYHGLDLGRFPAPPVREGGGNGQGAPVKLVSIGRLVAKKGYDDLLQALALLPAGLNWHLTQIGGGELAKPLAETAQRLGLASRIDWLGARPQGQVIEALRAADLFVLACREGDGGDRDGLPNVLMEAATQGLPILSTDFAGVPEFVTDGVEGLLVPPRNPAALAEGLSQLIGQPALRLQLGAAAHARVTGDFSADVGIGRIAALLSQGDVDQRAETRVR